MRLLAIGDIHGCSEALTTLLEAVAPGPEDRLITLGDYVDRGPDSRGVLDLLITLHDTGRLVALRGNHDIMMLGARDGGWYDGPLWLSCGGDATIASYGIPRTNPLDLGRVPERHWKFLTEDCVDWYETEHHFFVHANAAPNLEFAEQPEYLLYWEKLTQPCAHFSDKVMVCGHTRQASGLPLNLGTTICIDTGAYDPDGWLTCLDVLSGHYWQANQCGRWREGRLKKNGEGGMGKGE